MNPTEVPFDLKTVPLAPVASNEETTPNLPSEGMIVSTGPAKLIQLSREDNYTEKLSAIPGIAQLGPLFRSSDTAELTESETEYVVRCIKHVYTSHLVLQFDCLNTLNDQLLENVRVQLEPAEGYTIMKEIPCAQLPYNETGQVYVILRFPEDLNSTVGSFGATLKFVVKDCDPTTGLPDSDEGEYLHFLNIIDVE